MKIKFRNIRLSKANQKRLLIINSIIEEYQRQGYKLTLRQLYYQLVSRDVIPNRQAEYSKLSTLLKEGRMGGVVDWDAIEDRLRTPYTPASWDNPEDLMDTAISQYALPRMEGQENYIEVWVEKDALSGVLKRVTKIYHIPIVVNRGYSSVSAMYDAYNRFFKANGRGQAVKILYLGDYDPSGIDMIRDIADRSVEFMGDGDFDFEVLPIALTSSQISQYNPPPNPAKLSDPRSSEYIKRHGSTSWEVDALRPDVLNDILTMNIKDLIDEDLYLSIVEKEGADKEKLIKLKTQL